MQASEIIKELTQYPAVSGFEADFCKIAANKLGEYCSDVQITRSGCVAGKIKCNRENAKTVMLEAHLDRIGLIVSEICDNGFVKFAPVGGVDERILPGGEVYILGKEKLYGVIGAKPPHLMSNEETALEIDDMTIDTGLTSETLGSLVTVGDPILLRSTLTPLMGNHIASAALDNRAGMSAIFLCLEKIKDLVLPYDIVVCFTTGEETGLHGAYTLPATIQPDLAVVVDVTHGTTPDAPSTGTFDPGSGAAVCRGPNLHYDYTKAVISLAREKSIPYEIEVASGHSGTNAWALQNLGGGIPCVLLSIPLRYMHTSVEVVNTADVEAVSSLLAEIVSGGVTLA